MLVFGFLSCNCSHRVFNATLDLNRVHRTTNLTWVYVIILVFDEVHLLAICLVRDIGYALEVHALIQLIVIRVLGVLVWIVLLIEASLWLSNAFPAKLSCARAEASICFIHFIYRLNLILKRVPTELLLVMVRYQSSLTWGHHIWSIAGIRFYLHLLVWAQAQIFYSSPQLLLALGFLMVCLLVICNQYLVRTFHESVLSLACWVLGCWYILILA